MSENMPTKQIQSQNTNLLLEEKDLMEDLLTSQKKISSDYNTFCSEVVNMILKQDVLNLIKDEHEAESMIFGEIQSKGWYETKVASQQDLQNAQQKFQKMEQYLRMDV